MKIFVYKVIFTMICIFFLFNFTIGYQIRKIENRILNILLKRYKNTGELKTHLILNHLTVLFNVFDDATVPLLFYNLEDDLWPYIKSFFVFLNRIPEYPKTIISEIEVDDYCLEQLKEL